MKRFLLPLFVMSATPFIAQAQLTTAPAAPATPAAELTAAAPTTTNGITNTPLADAKDAKVKVVMAPGLFSAPKVPRPLKMAVYFGGGAGKGNSDLLVTAGKRLEGAVVDPIGPEEVGTKDLSQYDIIVFAGGSGSGQSKAIGEKGLEAVRTFVKNGGSYLGICAGAYLACSNYPWSLGLMNAKTRSSKWQRGGGAVALELTGDGQKLFGDVEEKFPVRYNNGPIIEPDNKPDAPPYTVIAYFRDELAEHGTPVGLMKDTPAAMCSQYGKGKVLTISPHFEGTKNAENFLPTALAWLGDKNAPMPAPAK
nr:MAG: biofilm PGA synthesis protein PgaB [bacterium]